jgi:hypothetical protein
MANVKSIGLGHASDFGEGSIVNLKNQRPVERLCLEAAPAISPCHRGRFEIEVEHDSFFCGANLHKFETLAQLNNLMRHELKK